MIGPWINNESQRLVAGLGNEQCEGPKLDMTLFVVGLVLYFLSVCYYIFLPVPEKYSDLGTSTVTCAALATLCFFLQQEYRPRADQLGFGTATLLHGRAVVWVVGGMTFTAVQLGLMYGFAQFVLSAIPQHHAWTVGLQPLSRVVRHPYDLLITVVIGPVLEELFFRGYLYLVLRHNWGRRRAALISSVVFAAMHLPVIFIAVTSFFASLIYIYLDNKAKSLAPSVAAHVSYNAVLMLLKSTLT